MSDATRKAPARPGLGPPSTRPRCPVCRKDVFSKSGIHPQCAVARQDAEFRASQKQIKLALKAALAEG
jgi:hypothetical protein